MRLSRATVRKMKQNLAWASVYNIAAIPIAAGVLFPAYGIELRPEWSALLMSLSSIIVPTNAVLLKALRARIRRSSLTRRGPQVAALPLPAEQSPNPPTTSDGPWRNLASIGRRRRDGFPRDLANIG